MNLNESIYSLIRSEVSKYIYQNLQVGIKNKRRKRICLCGCARGFSFRTKYHHFYSRQCYARYHRIPGFVKKIVDHKD